MAERVGVSVAQISRWENGINAIPQKRIERILIAYEANARDLFEPHELLELINFPLTSATIFVLEPVAAVHLPRDVPLLETTAGSFKILAGVRMEQITLNFRKVVGFLPRPALIGGQKGTYGIYVRGSSMSPRYEDGQTLFVQDVRLGQSPSPSDDVV